MSAVSFDYYNPTRIYFGCGRRKVLAELIALHGWKAVALVIDHGVKDIPMVLEIESALTGSHLAVTTGYCDMAEPSYAFLDQLRKKFEHAPIDVVVGIGGGSALDAAKAMAVLVHNRAPAVTYRGFDKMTGPVLPVIALPTTAGTGSEVTPNASFIDTVEKRKLGINGEAVRPKLAILDPELTLSCPVRPTVSAAVDALVHATEAYVAKKTNPIARFFAREEFARVFNSLPKVVEHPRDIKARTELLYGSHLAGVALMHSGTGPAAAMSYPLGVLHYVPHGVGGALFLPFVAAHNVSQGVVDYADLHAVMADADPAGDRQAQAMRFVQRLREMWQRIGVPDDLSGHGINVSLFTDQTLLLAGALEQNPASFGAAEIRATLRALRVAGA